VYPSIGRIQINAARIKRQHLRCWRGSITPSIPKPRGWMTAGATVFGTLSIVGCLNAFSSSRSSCSPGALNCGHVLRGPNPSGLDARPLTRCASLGPVSHERGAIRAPRHAVSSRAEHPPNKFGLVDLGTLVEATDVTTLGPRARAMPSFSLFRRHKPVYFAKDRGILRCEQKLYKMRHLSGADSENSTPFICGRSPRDSL